MSRVFITPNEPPNYRRSVTMLVVKMAEQKAAERFGERFGNNGGPDIVKMRSEDGTGGKHDTDGAWCASYLSWLFVKANEEAAQAYNLLPWPKLWFRPSRGAKRLVDYIIEAGGKKITNYLDVRRGDVLLSDRPGPGAHVMIATDRYDAGRRGIPMADGNRGKFPAIADLGYLAVTGSRGFQYAARPY